MIKFETINGTLCRMVEPTPLQLDSEFPCAVRLIQDDSPMGLCNRWKYSEKQDLLKKDWNISSLENNLNKVKDIHYSQFEIIGYPVQEGSAEWALYQMMQGKMVCHETSPRDWYRMYNDHAIQNRTVGYMDRVSAWLESTVQSGWQIYKEPELKYKVGDWVEIESSYTKGKTFVSVIKEMPNQEHYTVSVNSSFGRYTVRGVMERQIVRKLKPSEIIVRIGFLSGTVRPVSTNGIHIWFHLIGVDDKTIATIRISCLDAPTRELVESLLEAMREEKK